AEQEAAGARDARRAERDSRREMRRAERAALRARAVEFVRERVQLGDAAPIVERSGDRVVVSVNLTSGLVVAATLCVIFFATYMAGRRAGMGGGGGQFVEVAAVTPVEAERPAAPRIAARPERQT